MLKILTTLAFLAAAPPFPAPKVTTVTDDTKFTSGTVATVDVAKNQLKVTAPDGIVTFQLSPSALIVGSNGQATTLAALRMGESVNVYYLVQNGAIASEIDAQD